MRQKTELEKEKTIPQELWDVVVVDWVDAKRGAEWCPVEDLDLQRVVCRSIGYKIADNETAIVVAPHVGFPPLQACGEMIIPKPAIISITIVRSVPWKIK